MNNDARTRPGGSLLTIRQCIWFDFVLKKTSRVIDMAKKCECTTLCKCACVSACGMGKGEAWERAPTMLRHLKVITCFHASIPSALTRPIAYGTSTWYEFDHPTGRGPILILNNGKRAGSADETPQLWLQE